jgi:hypothetical protein
MEGIATGFRRQWMENKPAGHGISRINHPQYALEIALGLFFGPIVRTGGQRLQMKYAARKNMAAVTAGVARPLLQEDWFHFLLEQVVPGRGLLLR